jgi:hypothetical protein
MQIGSKPSFKNIIRAQLRAAAPNYCEWRAIVNAVRTHWRLKHVNGIRARVQELVDSGEAERCVNPDVEAWRIKQPTGEK